jgi:GPI transamidase subunit PIG-U
LANGSIRIPPLLLATLFPFLDDTAHPEFWLAVILFLLDLAIAYLLEQIGINVLILSKNSRRIQEEEARQRLLPDIIQPDYAHIFPIYTESDTSTTTTITKKPLLPMSTIPRCAALLYFGSPSTILPSSLYGCWQNLPTLLVLASIYEASCGTGYYAFSSCLLAVAAYLEPYSAVYAIPAILLFQCSERRRRGAAGAIEGSSIRFVAMIFTIFLLGWSLMLQGMTLSLVGSTKLYWTAMTSVYGSTYLTTSPNLSMQWYFSMQLFARFRDYFGTMFLGLPFVLMGPLTVRLWKYPEVLVSHCTTIVVWE